MPINYQRPSYTASTSLREDSSYKITIPVERWRLIAYACFWFMIVFAIVVTRTLSVEFLAKGVDKSTVPRERWGCGPFNRVDTEFDIGYGDGFDFRTENHLKDAFGYSNICTNWDYPIARELTAMVFPFFEYSLVVYLVLDFVATMLSHRRGELPEWFWRLTKLLTPLVIYLCINFRMIFVCIAYEDVSKHTAGFLGLQIALLIVASTNAAKVILTGQSYPTRNLSRGATRRLACVYLVLNGCICTLKLWGTAHICRHGIPPDWTKRRLFDSGIVVGQVVDQVWMVMVAMLPMIIAKIRMDDEDPLTIQFTVPRRQYLPPLDHESDDPRSVEEATKHESDDPESGGDEVELQTFAS